MTIPGLDAGAYRAGQLLKTARTPTEATKIISQYYGRGGYTAAQESGREGMAEAYGVTYGDSQRADLNGKNIPPETQRHAEADAGSSGLEGTAVTFHKFNVLMGRVNDNLKGLATAPGKAARALSTNNPGVTAPPM